MSVNVAPAANTARQPRGLAKIAGVPVQGWVEMAVENNVFSSADTFSVDFACGMLPELFNAAWFANQTSITVDLFAGNPVDPENYTETDLTQWISGNVDHLDYNLAAQTITVSGRDKSALLIDTRSSEKYQNLTSSQIATMLAQKHGLTPVVTATTLKAGTFYEIDFVTLADQRSEWDLLTYLASREQFVAYVHNNELHFEPRPDGTADPYLIEVEMPNDDHEYIVANGGRINFSRDLTIAKGVTVTVRTHNVKTGKTLTVTWPARIARPTKPGQSAPSAQNYFYIVANKTADEALKIAQQRYADIIRHEMKLAWDGPGDNLLQVPSIIQVQGTATAFDQIYYPEAIRRSLAFEGGFDMHFTAKNTSPGNSPVI